MTTYDKDVWRCTQCGSDRVFNDAWVGINDPQEVMTFSATYCDSCGGDCAVVKEPKIEAEYDKPFPTLSVSNETGADWQTFSLITIPTGVSYVVTMHSGEKFEGNLLDYSYKHPMPARFQLWGGADWTGEIRTVSLTAVKSLEVM